MKLTPIARKRLQFVADYRSAEWPAAPLHGGPTDQALLRRGLIERADVEKHFSDYVRLTIFLCRITDAGRASLSGDRPKEDRDV